MSSWFLHNIMTVLQQFHHQSIPFNVCKRTGLLFLCGIFECYLFTLDICSDTQSFHTKWVVMLWIKPVMWNVRFVLCFLNRFILTFVCFPSLSLVKINAIFSVILKLVLTIYLIALYICFIKYMWGKIY